MILLGDMNANLGDSESPGVGPLSEDRENNNGTRLRSSATRWSAQRRRHGLLHRNRSLARLVAGQNVRKIAAHQITASDLNTITITFPDNMRMKSGDELISMKETFGLCEGKAEQHYYIPVRAIFG